MVEARKALGWFGWLAFAGASVPLAVAGHLISEAAALHDRSGSLAYSPRHAYLYMLAFFSIGVLGWLGTALRKRGTFRSEQIVRALPFGGEGPRFVGLSFLTQIAFFAVTQAIEGSPMLSGDFFAGIAVAVLAAALASLLLVMFERHVVTCIAFVAWISAKVRARESTVRFAPPVVRFSGRRGAFLASIANRPPPVVR